MTIRNDLIQLDGQTEIADPVFVDQFKVEDDKLYRVRTQPTEDIIMEHNKALRNNPGAIQDLSYGRLVADIPEIIYQQALKDGFQFNHPDAKIAASEKRRFLRTDVGRACLVQDKQVRFFHGR